METITLENSKYEFVKVGRFVKSKAPLKVRFEGKDDEVTMELELCHEDIKKVGECVYLVTVFLCMSVSTRALSSLGG